MKRQNLFDTDTSVSIKNLDKIYDINKISYEKYKQYSEQF